MSKISLKLFIFCISSSAVAVQGGKELFQGDHGCWEIDWQGSDISLRDTNGLSPAAIVVHAMLHTARQEDIQKFHSFFEKNSDRAEIARLFELFQKALSKGKALLPGEARFGCDAKSESDARVIAILTPYPATGTNLPLLRTVSVVRDGGNWFINLAVTDAKLVGLFKSRLAPLLGKGGSPEETRSIVLEHRQQVLNELKRRNMPRHQILAMKETFEMEDEGKVVHDWHSWTNRYATKILDPPLIFDARDPFGPDYSAPVAAFRSHVCAVQAGDGNALLKYADEEGKKQLIQNLGIDLTKKVKTYNVLPKLTQRIVLMTATTRLEGNEYAVIMARTQNRDGPKESIMFFETYVFRLDKGTYLYTSDAESSPFYLPMLYSGIREIGFYRYPEFFQHYRESQLPPHFYTVQ